MQRPLGRAMPARIALDCMSAGEPVTLAVLGMGVIENSGPDDDLRVADAYADLATEPDAAGMVHTFYEDQVAEHAWMAEPLKPILALLAKPGEDLQEKVKHVAGVLKDLSIRGCEEWAEVDLLGRVILDMVHLAHRRKYATGYMVTPYGTALDALLEDPEAVYKSGTMTDLWCGSGMRAVGLATAMRAVGRDPEKIQWTLLDADPMMRLIAAINCRAYDMGENIVIADGSSYKEAILAAVARGDGPLLRGYIDMDSVAALPADIASGVRDR